MKYYIVYFTYSEAICVASCMDMEDAMILQNDVFDDMTTHILTKSELRNEARIGGLTIVGL